MADVEDLHIWGQRQLLLASRLFTSRVCESASSSQCLCLCLQVRGPVQVVISPSMCVPKIELRLLSSLPAKPSLFCSQKEEFQ